MRAVPFDIYSRKISEVSTIKQSGRVVQIVGLVVESIGPAVSIGDLCRIECPETVCEPLAIDSTYRRTAFIRSS